MFAHAAEHNIPHNLLICEEGRRVIFVPNAFSHACARGSVPEHVLVTNIQPACFEMCGHMMFKREEDFYGATEELCADIIAQGAVDEETYADLCRVAREVSAVEGAVEAAMA